MKFKLPMIVLVILLLSNCTKDEDVELESGFIDGKIVYTDEGDIWTKDLNWTNPKQLTFYGVPIFKKI